MSVSVDDCQLGVADCVDKPGMIRTGCTERRPKKTDLSGLHAFPTVARGRAASAIPSAPSAPALRRRARAQQLPGAIDGPLGIWRACSIWRGNLLWNA